jgi:hypothetical protein
LHSSASSLKTAPPTSQQVNDKNNQRDNQEKVNQTAGNMEAEAQKPEHENDDKDRPKHIEPFHAT